MHNANATQPARDNHTHWSVSTSNKEVCEVYKHQEPLEHCKFLTPRAVDIEHWWLVTIWAELTEDISDSAVVEKTWSPINHHAIGCKWCRLYMQAYHEFVMAMWCDVIEGYHVTSASCVLRSRWWCYYDLVLESRCRNNELLNHFDVHFKTQTVYSSTACASILSACYYSQTCSTYCWKAVFNTINDKEITQFAFVTSQRA